MKWQEVEQKLSSWMPAVHLERSISHKTRRTLKNIPLLLSALSLALAWGLFSSPAQWWMSIFFLSLGIFIILALADAFFYSYFFKNENGEGTIFGFELATIFLNTDKRDVTRGFLSSLYGELILSRLGIERSAVKDFLIHRRGLVSADSITFSPEEDLLDSYLVGIVSRDSEFATFLASRAVTEEIFVRCSKWLLHMMRKRIDSERWWSEDNLSSIQGIGRDWAYGKTYFLSRFSNSLRVTAISDSSYHAEETLALESILSKSRESNAIIVGEEGAGKIEIIESLARKIQQGHSSHSLEDRKFVVFETALFVSALAEKNQFEQSLLRVLMETASAGNVVLIIPDFHALFHGAAVLGSDIPSLLDSFLASSVLQVIAITNTRDFHSSIEANQIIMQRFDTLLVKGGDESQILSVLEDDIAELEGREKTFFTYQAIFEAVSGANRYFVGKPLLDTALDLLAQAVANARVAKRYVVTKEDVLDLIRSKTGIPMGEVTGIEKTKLTHLEDFLHQRIIGQNEAISAIANALRRARTGITNPDRPMGSFLFLGPTGVGKTETTKALAEMFFGSEAQIMRLDMSEYNTEDAINRLIGSIGEESGGILGSMIREKSYGVLLLDEFEKTDKRVLDLFLQILDEGIFSDSLGRKISARNLIIIATSNAGSDLIFNIINRGESLEDKKHIIIEEIVRQGIYKPELINRFDGVILFHPLEQKHLKEVARLMLEKLARRLKKQGIDLTINTPLIEFLVSRGSDPKFGARALNRALQDTVEKVIADKIISGALHRGSTLELTTSDLES